MSAKRATPDDSTPGTAERQVKRRKQDRVALDVGGELFHTSQATLISNSMYFSRLFSDSWCDDGDGPQFLDRDPDAFRVLLSCMRTRSIILSEKDPELCARVLLEAEFLGVEWLLQEVKARAARNLNEEEHWFDQRFPGGLSEAISEGVLPARWFSPEAPAAPEPPDRIVALQPVSHAHVAMGMPPGMPPGVGGDDFRDTYRVVALAVVQSADGATWVEPLVAPANVDEEDFDDKSELKLASKFRSDGGWDTWQLRQDPRIEPLPLDTVVSAYESRSESGEDEVRETKYSVPFVRVFPPDNGCSIPRVEYLDVQEDGQLKPVQTYSDFKAFSCSSHVDRRRKQFADMSTAMMQCATSPEAADACTKMLQQWYRGGL